MQPEYFIECSTNAQAFEKAAWQFLAEGEYTPDDIFDFIKGARQLQQVPLYYFDIGYEGSATGEVGHSRTETYVEFDKEQTRSVTDWFPYSEYIHGETDALLYAGKVCEDWMLAMFEGFKFKRSQLKKTAAGDKEAAALGALFVTTMDEGWNRRGRQIALNKVQQYESDRLKEKDIRDLNISVKLSEQEKYSLVAPYWFFNYTYSGSAYTVIADATNLGRITGTRPTDEKLKTKVQETRRSGWIMGIAASIGSAIVWATAFDPPELSILIGAAGLTLTWLVTEFWSVARLKREARERRLYSKSLKGK
jgi:hypothetical protein